MIDGFAGKLALVLRALAISRGRLAADLVVNKSVVSRWHSGRAVPSGENFSRLTRLIAVRLPGFTGLDWDRDLEELAELLGQAPAAKPPRDFDVPGFARLEQVRALTQRHGSSWEGHWWGYRQTFRDHDELVRDKIRIRRHGEFLVLDWCHDIVAGDGWFMVGDGKGYVLLPHRYSDVPAIITLYTMDGKLVQILDGLITTTTISAAREMVAAPYVMVRAANLLPDAEADDRFFRARSPEDWVVDPSKLDSLIRARLTPVIRPGGMLRIASDTSLTRFCTPAETQAAAKASLIAYDQDRNVAGAG